MSPSARSLLGTFEQVGAYLRSRTALALALWGFVGLAGILLVAWVLAGPEGWETGTRAPILLDLLLLGIVLGSIGAYRVLARRWIAEARVAVAVEKVVGLSPGKLQSAVELARRLPRGVSSALAERAQQTVLVEMRRPQAELAGEMGQGARRWTMRGGGLLALLMPLLVMALIYAPARATTAWAGLARPVALMRPPVFEPLGVLPGSVAIPRGDSLLVSVDAEARTEVTVRWQAAGDVPRSQVIPIEGGAGSFQFDAVNGELTYWVTAPDGAESDRFEVVPVDPLLVSDITLELTFPPHTGRFPEEYRGQVPPLVIPAGTRVRLRGVASRGLSAGSLQDATDGADVVDLSVDGRTFDAEWRPAGSGVYSWTFTDVDGAEAEVVPEPLELTVEEDQAPLVALLVPGRDTVFDVSLSQPLVVETSDDYGLSGMELVVTRVGVLGVRGEPMREGMELGGTRGALVRPILDVSQWEMTVGETVRYYIQVTDNGLTPQVARTPEFELRLPSASQLREEAQDRLEQAVDELEALSERAAEEAQELRDLERSAGSRDATGEQGRREPGERAGFEEREDLQQALESQEQLLGDVDSLEAQLSELSEQLQEAGLGDPVLQRLLEELERLLEEVAPDEMKDRAQDLSERMDEMDAQEAREGLEELSQDEEELRARLEDALERFRQAALKQDFQAATDEAEELARQEEALSEAIKEGDEDPELRADQQEALEERADALEERMERLQEGLTESGELEARAKVESAEKQLQEARASMNQAGQQARSGQQAEAGETAEDAAEQLKEVAEQLQEAQAEMAQDLMDAMKEALEQTASDAVAMARQQSGLREGMRGASQETMSELRGAEAALAQGVRNMADNLAIQSRLAQGDTRELSGGMGQVLDALEATLTAMGNEGGRTGSPLSSAEEAVERLNEVAMNAMAAAEQTGQSGEGEGSMSEQLDEIADQQNSVNNQTEQLTPMQLGEEAMGDQLSELAEGQQSIASDLGELADEPGASESLGDLQALAEEAREIAEALAGGRMEPELLERQDKLFNRLLDAGRTLENDDESDERESEAPGAFEGGEVLPLSPEALGALRFGPPSAEVLERLTPSERQLVLQYFERLNRQRRVGGNGGS